MSQKKKARKTIIRPQTAPASYDDPVYTTRELAEDLNKSPRTLERWRVDGYGPAFVKAGKTPLYRQSAVRQWMDQQTRTFTGEESPSRS